MTVPKVKTPRGIARRLLCSGLILLLVATRAGSNEAEELGLAVDSISTAASSVDTTPAAITEQQSDENHETAKQNHTVSSSAPSGGMRPDPKAMCPSGLQCSKLGGECIDCSFNTSCVYGQEVLVWCQAQPHVNCTSNAQFQVSMVCRYCYQVEPWEQTCLPLDRQRHCKGGSTQREKERYRTNCTAKTNIVCLGHRTFPKYLPCNWTAGYKWTTALVLSITLGGFGADRFYLGHWQEGIGKLFSFGGLGVWTLLDVILIAVGYLGPADGSLYIW